MKTTGQSLVIRADASPQIGTGHLMRCLALAQAWRDTGGQVFFVTALPAQALSDRLAAEGMEVMRLAVEPGSDDDAIETTKLAQRLHASSFVLDGYNFLANYQRRVRDSGLYLLLIDDNGRAASYYADAILNQNLHADESLYLNREPGTKLLLGSRYVLLRHEFLKWRAWQRETPDVARKLLITLGGGDDDKASLKVVQALEQVEVDKLEAIVVAGAGNPHYDQLQTALNSSRHSIRLESHVTDMPELMAWADAAVSGSGSTCWEMAFMGLPNLMLVLAENQLGVAAQLEARGIALHGGWHTHAGLDSLVELLTGLIRDGAQRRVMSERGRRLIDGDGAARVADILREAGR